MISVSRPVEGTVNSMEQKKILNSFVKLMAMSISCLFIQQVFRIGHPAEA
jgi:hypothetical protein